jgi:hypothetical protein
VPIPGATKSYHHFSEKLDANAEYRVLLTRVGDDYAVFTCSVEVELRTDDISLYPTIMTQGEYFTLNMPAAGRAVIGDVIGVKISEHILQPGANTINILQPQGTYFIQVTNENSEQRTFTILVR